MVGCREVVAPGLGRGLPRYLQGFLGLDLRGFLCRKLSFCGLLNNQMQMVHVVLVNPPIKAWESYFSISISTSLLSSSASLYSYPLEVVFQSISSSLYTPPLVAPHAVVVVPREAFSKSPESRLNQFPHLLHPPKIILAA